MIVLKHWASVGVCVLLLGAGGCVAPGGEWGQTQWPSGVQLRDAARTAATEPGTWIPALTAGLLAATDLDEEWSEDLAREQALFGSDADNRSNTLRDATTAAWLVSALVLPSSTYEDKLKGLGVGVATMAVDGLVTEGLKDLTNRERPDGSNRRSFPSGHSSKASSRAALTIHNLQHSGLPQWSKQLSVVGMHTLAVGTGLARVEAEKHHLSDVIFGYAAGRFIARFMTEAFMREGARAHFEAALTEQGTVVTLRVPLR